MKKPAAVILAAALAAAIVLPASAAVTIKLKGGAAYVFATEYNAGLRGAGDYLTAVVGSPAGDYRPLHLGAEFGAEIIVPLGGGFSLGLGAGYLRASSESIFAYDSLLFTVAETITPRITAVPIVLNFHYELSLGKALRLDLYAGAGCTLATFRQDFRTTADFFSFEETESFLAHKAAFGGQAGIALEFEIARGFDIFVQAEGRLAALTDIRGDATSQGNWFLGSWTGGASPAYLWAYTLTDSEKAYPQLAVSLGAPSGTGISAVGKARLDLSGASIAAGIRIRL